MIRKFFFTFLMISQYFFIFDQVFGDPILLNPKGLLNEVKSVMQIYKKCNVNKSKYNIIKEKKKKIISAYITFIEHLTDDAIQTGFKTGSCESFSNVIVDGYFMTKDSIITSNKDTETLTKIFQSAVTIDPCRSDCESEFHRNVEEKMRILKLISLIAKTTDINIKSFIKIDHQFCEKIINLDKFYQDRSILDIDRDYKNATEDFPLYRSCLEKISSKLVDRKPISPELKELKKLANNIHYLDQRLKKEKKVGYGLSGEVYRIDTKSNGTSHPFIVKKIYRNNVMDMKDLVEEKGINEIKLREVLKEDKQINKSNDLKIEHELKIHNKLSGHKNIPSAYGLVKTREYFLLGMDSYDGDLRKLQAGEIDTNLFSEMIDGVVHMHKNNICHYDIRPENFLFSRGLKNRAFITDFGGSVEGCDTESIIYTPEFAPLEFFLRVKGELLTHGKKFDIFSLGVSIIEMLDRQDKLKDMKNEDYKFLPQFDNMIKSANRRDIKFRKNQLVKACNKRVKELEGIVIKSFEEGRINDEQQKKLLQMIKNQKDDRPSLDEVKKVFPKITQKKTEKGFFRGLNLFGS